MDQIQQDAVIGKAHRELHESSRRLGALTKEAIDLGNELVKAGQALQQMPAFVEMFAFEGDAYVMGAKPSITVNRETFDAERISRLLQDIRTTEKLIKQAKAVL